MTHAGTLDLDQLWQTSLDDLTGQISNPAQRDWLTATRPVGFSDDTIILASPHRFARDWLESRCGDRIRATLTAAAGRDLTVVITVQPNPEPVERMPEPSSSTHATDDDASDPIQQNTDDVAGSDGGPATPHRHTASPPSAVPLRAQEERRPPMAAERGEPPIAERGPVGDTPLEAPGRPPGETVRLPQPRPSDPEVEPDTRLNPKYVFDNFVIGASNRFAHAAAFAVAESPAKAYNPLFIYGGAGLGKTHLLHAVGHYVRSLYPRLRVRYVTTEQFTNEFINSVRDHRMTDFQRTYRQTDILLVDDIQFLEGKEQTQEEFFHTFNALHNAEKQIVLSSDRPPKRIDRLEERLRSRFEWGLITDIQPPDLETRIAILRKKSEMEHLNVPAEVLEFIASRVQSNIRELEGALIRVTAFASLQRSSTDLSMAETVLKDLFPDDNEQEVSVSLIMEETASYFSFTLEELCSRSRSRQLVTARQIAMYLVREMTDLSLPRIGKHFGGRDHTTVMHAKDKIANLMTEKRTIYDQVTELTNRIKTRARAA